MHTLKIKYTMKKWQNGLEGEELAVQASWLGTLEWM